MEVNVTTLEGLKRRISGRIEAEQVTQRTEKALRQVAKSAQIRGFRPGKAPKAMLERRFGSQIKADVAAELLEEYFPLALEQSKVEPISPPEVERAEIEDDGSMAFDIVVEVAPKLNLGEYKGLTAKRPKFEISDEEVEQRVAQVREQHATIEPLEEERPLADGDWAQIDFKGMLDGEPFEGGTAENYRLQVGAKRMIEDLEQGLIGMVKDEQREIPVKFPDNYGNAELAGKNPVFEVKLREIMQRIVPEADDELAKDAGEESFAALCDKLRDEIEQTKAKQADNAAQESLLDELLTQNPLEAPARLVERRLDAMQEQLKRNLVRQGLPEDQAAGLVDSTRESGRERAQREVKVGFILSDVAKAEKIEISDEEIEAKYAEIAQSANNSVEQVAAMFQKQGQVEALRSQLADEKTIELLMSHATIVDVEPEQPQTDPQQEENESENNQAEADED
ncbi:MAG: trigger factor [Candidatus Alcyoniella australis]|nr:trigger factor [Candidatus Alcyoniella australis]